MSSKQISQMTKERLKEAVHDMAILTDDGIHPTSALIKVAVSLDLTDDQTRLVGRAYNTAHTADVREKGATILEKLATTPIADCEEAVSRLQTTKTASVDEVADIYKKDKDLQQYRGLAVKVAADFELQDFVKTASVKKAEAEKRFSLEKLFSDKEYLESEISKLAGIAERLKDRLEGTLTVLEKYAKRTSNAVRMATKIAAAQKFGKDILPLIENVLVAEQGDLKVASADESLLNRVEDIYVSAKQLRETIDLLSKVAKCRNKVNEEINKIANPGGGAVGTSFFDPSLWSKVFMVDKMQDVFKKEPKQDDNIPSVLPSRFVQHGIVTPEHKKSIDSIRMKSMVNDMLSNDDIISQYQPEDVYAVINELKATAPMAMARPSVVRSFVREALAKGNLGSYDLNPLMTYDKDIMRGLNKHEA